MRKGLLVLTAAACAPAQELTLAARGQPAACTIVRPASASPSQVYAAEELQRFTEEMTGVKLSITTDEAPLPSRAVLLGNAPILPVFVVVLGGVSALAILAWRALFWATALRGERRHG